MTYRHRWPHTLLVTGSLLLTSLEVAAVGTRTFTLDTLEDLSGGDLKGTSVDSLGRVKAGLNVGTLALSEADTVWSSLVQEDGSVLLGTGNVGKVVRIANGQAAPFANTGELAVTSMVRGFRKSVFLATLPHGKIFRLDGQKVSLFVELPHTEHVWALAFDPKQNALFAATGPEGKLYRIDEAGHPQVYFDSDEPHLVSLALEEGGSLLAGSSGKALLYRITHAGSASVLYDFPGDDVKAIALGPKGTIFAISNEYGEPPELAKRAVPAGQTAAGPVILPRPKAGKGTLTRFDESGRPEKLLRREDTHFVSLSVGDNGLPYVGTGVEGRVYSVDDAHTSTLVLDTDERQVGSLQFAGAHAFVATSDPPAFHEIRGVGGPDAVWTSKVLDAGLRAEFGRVAVHASGPVDFSTRTGNTLVPDATWSAWSKDAPAPVKVVSPAARFLQVRARFSRDRNAVISEIVVPFMTENLRAVLTSVDVSPKGQPVHEHEGFPPSGGDPPAHSSTLHVAWKVDNPDADSLRYRLSYRLEGETLARPLTRPDEILTKAEYDWDTANLPEGMYRLRVEATDEMANPPERVAQHGLESGIFLVDNTPPVFRALKLVGRKLTANVVDGLGPIARLDVAIDGRSEWHPLLPRDHLFDEAAEDFEVELGTIVPPGPHILAVRAFDQGGNFVVRTLEAK